MPIWMAGIRKKHGVVRMGHKGFATYNQRDEFISAGEEEEQFNNVFNYHGYRYALIEGLRLYTQKGRPGSNSG